MQRKAWRRLTYMAHCIDWNSKTASLILVFLNLRTLCRTCSCSVSQSPINAFQQRSSYFHYHVPSRCVCGQLWKLWWVMAKSDSQQLAHQWNRPVVCLMTALLEVSADSLHHQQDMTSSYTQNKCVIYFLCSYSRKWPAALRAGSKCGDRVSRNLHQNKTQRHNSVRKGILTCNPPAEEQDIWGACKETCRHHAAVCHMTITPNYEQKNKFTTFTNIRDASIIHSGSKVKRLQYKEILLCPQNIAI